MILRPYQEDFILKASNALDKHGNTLGVAPTGAGKSCMMSALAGRYDTSLILQHRDELVSQNIATYRRVNPHAVVDVFNSSRKRFLSNGTTFAMVQTLVRDNNLDRMKPVDLFIIDESHHAAADGYKKIIAKAKELNPNVHLFGVTATPNRGDKKGLKEIFNNVCAEIPIEQLIREGHLVRPRTFIIDCGFKNELDRVREEARKLKLHEVDMSQVEAIMDKDVVTDRVIEEWKKVAGDRRTIVFCSTVAHAQHVTDYFLRCDVKAKTVWGNMPDADRRQVLKELDSGETQVVVNVAVLTEGFDSQPVSCVILLRPCSYKSTMMQMIGRGLRPVDQNRYPGILKDDCIVMDFGFSLLTHGNFDMKAELDPKKIAGVAPTKTCCNDACGAEIPIQSMICPICGTEQPSAEKEEKQALSDFVMCEVDIINASPYKWENFFDGVVWMANGMTAWACTVNYAGRWWAVGSNNNKLPKTIETIGNFADNFTALSRADDFLRLWGDTESSRKSKQWLTLPPTDKQTQMLGLTSDVIFGLTRYRASCAIQWKFSEDGIKKIIINPLINLA